MGRITIAGLLIITALVCATVLALNGLHVWAFAFMLYALVGVNA